MPAENDNKKNLVVQISFDPDAVKTLEELKASYEEFHGEVSTAKVIRDAMGLLAWATNQCVQGERFCVIGKDNIVREVILPFRHRG